MYQLFEKNVALGSQLNTGTCSVLHANKSHSKVWMSNSCPQLGRRIYPPIFVREHVFIHYYAPHDKLMLLFFVLFFRFSTAFFRICFFVSEVNTR